MLQVIALDDVKPDEPRRYYPAHAIPDLGLTALTKANELDGPLHLRPWHGAKGSWVAIVDRPAPPPSLDLEAIGARLRDALGYWTARGSKSIVDGSKADDPIGDALTPWGHVARVALSIDRPAPTPTPAPGIDLDAVERAERAMTAGEWRHVEVLADGEMIRDEVCDADGNIGGAGADFQDANAAGIVALRNAAPALIAEVRALRSQVCRLVSGQAIESDALCQHHDADLAALAERDEARAEIARLTAELSAARAVAVDVCRYLDCSEPDLLAVVTSLYESRARAISDATAARGTVGGLLATAPVGAIVETRNAMQWVQIRIGHDSEIDDGADGEWRSWFSGAWRNWEVMGRDISISGARMPARLVPAAEADADPNQRGPLPKGG